MISTLLPIASIALKLGSYLLSSNAKAQPEPEPVQEERLPPHSPEPVPAAGGQGCR